MSKAKTKKKRGRPRKTVQKKILDETSRGRPRKTEQQKLEDKAKRLQEKNELLRIEKENQEKQLNLLEGSKVDTDGKHFSDPPSNDISTKLSYAEVTSTNKKKLPSSTFLLYKSLKEEQINSDNDDDTVHTGDLQLSSTRMMMMFTVPKKTEEDDDNTAPLNAIKKINCMVKSLSNKLPEVTMGPWSAQPSTVTKKDLVKTFVEDEDSSIDLAEQYVYNFNRFIRPGSRCYVRLQLFHPFTTSSNIIIETASTFSIPKIQYFKKAQSDAPNPLLLGTLTGSVSAMAGSKNFYDLFKLKFELKHLGLWWTQARSDNGGDWNRNKSVLHIEIDKSDQQKKELIEDYFNSYSTLPDDNFLGTPMTLIPSFNNTLDDDTKDRISRNVRSQGHLGKSVKSVTVHGISLNNWIDKTNCTTLLAALMNIESLYDKKVAGSLSGKTFKGRLFYAIVPNSSNKSATFYFSSANSTEGRSVARALPCFIRDHFKKDPSFFCSSDFICGSINGLWCFEKRTFQTQNEVEEIKRNNDLESAMNAEVFISKDHQRALAMKGNDDTSTIGTITRKDQEPPPAQQHEPDEMSDITGETRESKVKAAVKEVSVQYNETISDLQQTHEADLKRIQELETLLNQQQFDNDPTKVDLPPSPYEESDKTLAIREQFKNARTEYEPYKTTNPTINSKSSHSSSSMSIIDNTPPILTPSPHRKGTLGAKVSITNASGSTMDRQNKSKIAKLNDEGHNNKNSDGIASPTGGGGTL